MNIPNNFSADQERSQINGANQRVANNPLFPQCK